MNSGVRIAPSFPFADIQLPATCICRQSEANKAHLAERGLPLPLGQCLRLGTKKVQSPDRGYMCTATHFSLQPSPSLDILWGASFLPRMSMFAGKRWMVSSLSV
ncbi:hypothetical protein DL89DRAFT_107971 [Linderina pennispora]|uniref:Uncharacterized protein n=1 Tax=Linderina pennispora TaxID=61395 RepID=A0A1Y1WF17_9FUNG|nr:uncharacterized protein DL89DRAFT_107971 [Linderina pennispora]ORX72093.1 hypothetical protein DL89DRAFT_107971 [Linderina pennispora]